MAKSRPISAESRDKKGHTYFEQRENFKLSAKRQIAKYIVGTFLREGDSILLDAGTSLYPIAQAVAELAAHDPDSTHFTIMTHNYSAFRLLVEERSYSEAGLNIVLAGGRYDRDLNALFGPQTVAAYENFFPRVVLIGISAFLADQGLFCHGNTEELQVKQKIFQKTGRDRIVVADYTKLGFTDALRFGDSSHLHAGVERCVIVTDRPGDDEDKAVRERFQREYERLMALNPKLSVQIVDLKEQGVEEHAVVPS